MAGEDVKVTIGANATPYQVAMAKVKVTAKETAASIGVEFDRGASRAERRVERGMDGIIRSILKAKNPIEAIGGALEGLSAAFAIASTAFLAVGIGAALYEAFTTASEASEKLTKDIEDLSKVDAENESVHQLQRDIDGFQKIAEQYQNRGLLEKILFGNKEDINFAEASNLNDLKKDLVETRQLQDDLTKAQARTLEASSNPEDQTKGKQMLKELSDRDEKADLSDRLTAAQKELFDLKQKQNRASFIANSPSKALSKEDVKFADTFDAEQNDKQIEEAQKKVDQVKAVQAAVVTAEGAEKGKTEKTGDEAARQETNRVKEEQERRAKIAEESAEVGISGEQKAANLRKKIADETKADSAEIGPKQQSQELAEQNKILEDQLALKKQIADNDKEAATKATEAARKAEELKKQAESAKERRGKLTEELGTAQSEVATAQANAMGFHGTVSSLRREGFGRTPRGGWSDGQAKAVQASEKHLADIKSEIAQLNAKIGGGA